MNRLKYRTLVALAIARAAIVAVLPSTLSPVKAQMPVDVSLIQLIARPADFDKKMVRVIGFCHLEFEGNGLFVHRQDFEQSISKNGLWLDAPRGKASLSDRYVIVEA